MKHNKITFGVLAFVVSMILLISVGAIASENIAMYPNIYMFLSQFGVLLATYFFPLCMAWNSALYFIKYVIEAKRNHSIVSHVINVVRAALGISMIILARIGIVPTAHPVSWGVSGVIFSLFIAELVLFFVNRKRVKKAR